ncbi:MAG: gliding motility-associated C-terminal domain-containing protein [Saprospiraceae bacterium]|nr:gliding motility-associated C-terminal domain-containing protein [Saprospiraceae bacterium]
MLRKILFFLCLFAGNQLDAQVFPPEPSCVAGDTLYWSLPTNNCGAFQSYDIYVSQNQSGPYSLLTSITSASQDFYVDNNPGNLTYYYYMEGNYDCPGQMVLQSDTISNAMPEAAPLLSVNVNGTTVELEWTPSPSHEVYAYVIYRLIGANVDPIDTVYSGSTYVDVTAEPFLKSEQYYVLALDPCGNTSIFLDPHNTVYLKLSQDACTRNFFLEWNPYQNWVNGPAGQEVWVSVNGDPVQMVASLDATTDSYSFSDVSDGQQYCFYVRAIEAQSGRGANSNAVCATSDIIQAPDELAILNASLLNGGVEVDWLWNTNAELSEVYIEVTNPTSGTVQDIPWADFQNPLSLTNTAFLPNAISPSGPLDYRISAIDLCGDEWYSESIRTVFLEGTALFPGEFELSWSRFELEGATVIEYEIYRQRNLMTEFVGTVPGNTLHTTDYLPTTELKDEAVCYYLEVRFSQVLPSGETVIANSRSNVICLRPKPQMYIPNIFSPTGYNETFRPFIQFVEPGAVYELQIYDRWGALVFETSDLEEGWDGRTNGRLQPSGVYIFRFSLDTPTYGLLEQKGSITLIR